MAYMMTIASLATAAGTNSYLGREAPYYTVGFSFSIAMCAASILVATALTFALKWENRKRDRIQAEVEQRGEVVTPEIAFRYFL
jgi:type IV secretory pathway TrbF-like protein